MERRGWSETKREREREVEKVEMGEGRWREKAIGGEGQSW